MDYNLYTLPNGIRIVHREVPNTKVVHCGITLDIGSRDERPEQEGIAHFWEHMAFKGTRKRKAYHIINRLEVVGGELNAYTTKEKICFYSSILDKHFDRSVELLSDITFHSVFPSREIEKERSVILEEMAMYYDSPEDAILDDFEQVIFNDHPLGHNILGTDNTVSSISKDDFFKFLKENLDTRRLVFCSIGNISFKKVLKIAEKYFSEVPVLHSTTQREPFTEFKPATTEVKRQLAQAHCMLGSLAYPVADQRRLPLFMLINLLGGPGMTSRLNMALREKLGYVYSVEASYTSLSDSGFYYIYFGTEKKQLEKSISVIRKELKKLRQSRLGSLQLHTCKEQIMGQLAMAEESNINFMHMMGRSILDLGFIEPIGEIFDRIRNMDATQLQDVANEVFSEDQLSILKYLPE